MRETMGHPCSHCGRPEHDCKCICTVCNGTPNSPTEQGHEQARRELKKYADERGLHSWFTATFLDEMMAWHFRHAPQTPSREAIIEVLHNSLCQQKQPWATWIDEVATNLLALFRPASLGQGSGKPFWCEHIVWDTEWCKGSPMWRFKNIPEGCSISVANIWMVCPICRVDRPANAPH